MNQDHPPCPNCSDGLQRVVIDDTGQAMCPVCRSPVGWRTPDAPLLCLGCGYDLHASPADETGHVSCPECGRREAVETLIEANRRPYIATKTVLMHLFLTPLLYSFVGAIAAYLMAMVVDPEAVILMVIALGVGIMIIFRWNMEIAGEIVIKRKRLPPPLTGRQGPQFWVLVTLLTLAHVGLAAVYPLSGLACCCLLA